MCLGRRCSRGRVCDPRSRQLSGTRYRLPRFECGSLLLALNRLRRSTEVDSWIPSQSHAGNTGETSSHWQSADLLDLSHRGAAVLTRASQSFEIGAELSLDCSGVPGLGPSPLEAVVRWSQDDVDLADLVLLGLEFIQPLVSWPEALRTRD